MITEVIKHLTPAPMRVVYRRTRLWLDRRRNANLELAEVFDRVYARGEWGGGAGQFVSGPGSKDAQTTDYVTAVTSFVRDRGIRSLVDLGCGDFRVGSRIMALLDDDIRYVGVDIVPSLIDRNQRLFGSERVRFECKDLTRDRLPTGELCLVRQVLQHLSNAEISDVLAAVGSYRYVLISEHYPAPGRLRGPNYDKPHGSDTRVVDGSAVFLDQAPFGITGARLFHEVEALSPLVEKGEMIRSWLIEAPRISLRRR